ncbi:MAG TPA: translation initiation factor [Puia sp.]|jgi:translation initiation factor 1|nr:translation initiation factor [Puia sp.]
MSKKKANSNGIVYSTDPDFRQEEDRPAEVTPAPRQQKLRVRLDTKQRAGKAVTLVEGFAGRTEDLEDLGKRLKTHCGTGGSVKEGLVIVQGDQRDKILQWLLKNEYSGSKRAG